LKILFIGDIIGEPGRIAVTMLLPHYCKTECIDLVVVNGENSAGGFGITQKVAEEMFALGVDAITLGNHTWDRKEALDVLNHPNIVRPANYPPEVMGKGYTIVTAENGVKVGVINLMGRVFLSTLDCPFRTGESVLKEVKKHAGVVLIDFHAEITSEKQSMGWFFDGRVSVVVGTHTHVQTADERILPGGTAYITDVGMVGGRDGVIGITKEPVLRKYLTQLPAKFEVSRRDVIFNAVVIEVDDTTGKSVSIKRVNQVVGDL